MSRERFAGTAGAGGSMAGSTSSVSSRCHFRVPPGVNPALKDFTAAGARGNLLGVLRTSIFACANGQTYLGCLSEVLDGEATADLVGLDLKSVRNSGIVLHNANVLLQNLFLLLDVTIGVRALPNTEFETLFGGQRWSEPLDPQRSRTILLALWRIRDTRSTGWRRTGF